jgi:hypothetical protein
MESSCEGALEPPLEVDELEDEAERLVVDRLIPEMGWREEPLGWWEEPLPEGRAPSETRRLLLEDGSDDILVAMVSVDARLSTKSQECAHLRTRGCGFKQRSVRVGSTGCAALRARLAGIGAHGDRGRLVCAGARSILSLLHAVEHQNRPGPYEATADRTVRGKREIRLSRGWHHPGPPASFRLSYRV